MTIAGLAMALVAMITVGVVWVNRSGGHRVASTAASGPAAKHRSPTSTKPSHVLPPVAPNTGLQEAGPGCPQIAGVSTSMQSRGDGWIKIPGGPRECGGQALATYTTTSTSTVQDTYRWMFQTRSSLRCTLRIFIADANPSSAGAHYDVFSGANRIDEFELSQAGYRGRWATLGPWTTSAHGTLTLQLTDEADYPGAHHHVTASAVTLNCH